MIAVGKFTLRPWVRGLGAAPCEPAALCLTRTYHDARPAEILHVEAVSDLRAALRAFTSTGRLSAAISAHATTGAAIRLASVDCTSLGEARRVAADLLSPAKKSAPASQGEHPELGDLLAGVRKLHRQVVREEHRDTLRQVQRLLRRLL